MKEAPGVYCIRQISSGLLYVGSTSSISRRWSRHRKDLEKQIHRNKRLQEAYDLAAPEDFEYQILEWVDRPDLIRKEQEWMNKFLGKLFNDNPVAGSSLGRVYSREEYLKREPHMKTIGARCREKKVLARRTKAYSDNPSNHKLTLKEERALVAEYGTPIRRGKYFYGRVSLQYLSDKYGVCSTVAKDIIHGKKKRKC